MWVTLWFRTVCEESEKVRMSRIILTQIFENTLDLVFVASPPVPGDNIPHGAYCANHIEPPILKKSGQTGHLADTLRQCGRWLCVEAEAM